MALRESAATSDEGFREIQLTGKQLVFLFMATTIVSIVIFLCGVLVGRGARADVTVATRATTSAPPAEPPAGEPEPVDEAVSAEDLKNPTKLPQELSYQQRLDGGAGPAPKPSAPPAAAPAPPAAASKVTTPEPAMPSASAGAVRAPGAAPTSQPPAAGTTTTASPATAAAKPTPTPAPPPAPVAAKTAPAAATPAAPSAGDFVVQVAALENRREADQVVEKLSARGYTAFVLDPANGAKDKFYRVRVGRFADRAAAERTMKQLSQEGPYKPWITR